MQNIQSPFGLSSTGVELHQAIHIEIYYGLELEVCQSETSNGKSFYHFEDYTYLLIFHETRIFFQNLSLEHYFSSVSNKFVKTL